VSYHPFDDVEQETLRIIAGDATPESQSELLEPAATANKMPADRNNDIPHGILHTAGAAKQCPTIWDGTSDSYCIKCKKCKLMVIDLDVPNRPPLDKLLEELRNKTNGVRSNLWRRSDGRYVYGDCFRKRSEQAAYWAFAIGSLIAVTLGNLFFSLMGPCAQLVIFPVLIAWYGLGCFLLTRTVKPLTGFLILVCFLLPVPTLPYWMYFTSGAFFKIVTNIYNFSVKDLPDAWIHGAPLLTWAICLYFVFFYRPKR
jgi:hypothetical protein